MDMRNKRIILAICLTVLLILSAACGKQEDAAADQAGDQVASEEQSSSDQVASSEEMADVDEVTWESMVPFTGDQIADGEYEISVDSSSSMFNIEKCILTVRDGKMTAVMTMGGTGYRYIAMMGAEEAAGASESEYIYPEEDSEGRHTFTVDVEALDKGLKCSAFSDKKEKWYDRTLVFRSSGIPFGSFKEGVFVSASDLGLADGEYTVEIGFEGGSGRASVGSPATLTVSGGEAVATLVWSSPNYDYMIVNGEKYLPVNTEGDSVFEIPVMYFDRPVFVIADTTAMSEAHEIEYALTFSSESVK